MENEDKVREQLVQANQALQAEIYERQRTEEALRHRLAMEELVATISAHFIGVGSDEIEGEVYHALRDLGEFADVDHSHVTLFLEDGITIDRMYEWHPKGIKPRAQDLEGMSLEPFRWVMGQLGRFEAVHVPRVADLPPEASAEKELWGANGIRSVLTIPLVSSDSLIGVLGFSVERTDKEWSAEDIALLKLVGEVLTNVLAHKQADEALQCSLEETAHSRRLLLALSQAAQAVGRAHTTKEVYRIVGDQVTALGYNATIFALTDDRTHLVVSHLTFDSATLRAAEKLTGLSVQDYHFALTPGGFLEQVIHGTEAVFTRDDERPFLEALPRPIRPLAGRLMDLLGMDQSIVVPLMAGGEVHGLLAVTGSGLAEADVPAVSAFANQAAIAIENAELLTTVTEQKRDLRRLSARLMGAQEKERARLSRELHDEIGQALTAMSINLAEIEKRLGPELDPLIEERLIETSALAEQTSERISVLALDLRPSLLDDLGLVPTLRWYVSRYSERLGIQVEVETVDLEKRLDPEVETALYRVVQEALTNVARHACATRVRLRLERKASSAIATIEDNGRGFDTKELAGRDLSERGAGLVGMQERIALLGGSFRIQSDPGEGTRLAVEIPLRWRNGS